MVSYKALNTISEQRKVTVYRFNCTFMELKLPITVGDRSDLKVLIVPLWN